MYVGNYFVCVCTTTFYIEVVPVVQYERNIESSIVGGTGVHGQLFCVCVY